MAVLRRNPKLPIPILHLTFSTPKSPPPSHFSTLTQLPQHESSSTSHSPFFSHRRARSAIMSTSDPALIASILRSSSADRATYRLAVAKLARSGRKDLVQQLLEPMRTSPDATERSLVRVMALYSSAGMIDNVVGTFDQIPNRTGKSLCALLGAFLDNRLPGRARECFTHVPGEIGIVPGLSTWNLYLKALCEDGDIDTAAEFVLGKLHADNGVVPNIFSYNILLNAYLKQGDESSCNTIIEEITKKDLHPDLTTYNSRITMLCQKKNTAGAEKMFDEMLSKGIKPNCISYNTLLAGFCKDGDLVFAKKWFDRLCYESSGSGMAADGGSYVMLMKLMVEKGEVGMAVELCKECLRKKWAPPFDVVRAVVDGLVKDSKVGEAGKVVELMKGCVKGPALLAWIKFESTLPL